MTPWLALTAAALLGAAIAELWRRHHNRVATAKRKSSIEQALVEVHAADLAWRQAHDPYDARTYLLTGRLRQFGLAAEERSRAIRQAAAAGLVRSRPLLEDNWQVPYELQSSGYRYRPGPLERWQRFDRAAQTLAAIATSQDSSLDATADAHHQLATVALGLADELGSRARRECRRRRGQGSACRRLFVLRKTQHRSAKDHHRAGNMYLRRVRRLVHQHPRGAATRLRKQHHRPLCVRATRPLAGTATFSREYSCRIRAAAARERLAPASRS